MIYKKIQTTKTVKQKHILEVPPQFKCVQLPRSLNTLPSPFDGITACLHCLLIRWLLRHTINSHVVGFQTSGMKVRAEKECTTSSNYCTQLEPT